MTTLNRRKWAILSLAALALSACEPSSGFPAKIGQTFRDKPAAPEMVVIPAGKFVMGSTESETTREGRRAETAAWERPQHEVRVTKPFAVSVGHVSRAEFSAFADATGRDMAGCMVRDGAWQLQPDRSFRDIAVPQTDTDPVVCVSPADADAYAQWLSKETGHTYRLLHEAEWEYAARGGTATTHWWGDDRGDLCRYVNAADMTYDKAYPGEEGTNKTCDDGFMQTNPRDTFPANPFGLRNMIGDAWQWTADCFVAGYEGAPTEASGAVNGGDCAKRVIRGGSWHNFPDALRSAARFWLPTTMRSSSVGFRVMRERAP